jgi:hypothetical protein
MGTRNFVFVLALARSAFSQGQPPAPAKSAREEAPIDLTGYRTSIVTQDWLYRMRTTYSLTSLLAYSAVGANGLETVPLVM